MQQESLSKEALFEKITEAEDLAKRITNLPTGPEKMVRILRWAIVGDEAAALIRQMITADPANEFLLMWDVEEKFAGCWYKYSSVEDRMKAISGKSLKELDDEALAQVGFFSAARPGDLVELVRPFWMTKDHAEGNPPDYPAGTCFRVVDSLAMGGEDVEPKEVELMSPDLYERFTSSTPPPVTATLVLPRSYVKKVE